MTSDEPRDTTDEPQTDQGLPEEYDEPSETYESYFTITDSGILIDEPEYRDTTFQIRPTGVPYHGSASIDFYYGRPVLYLYELGAEEAQYVIALPTDDDPQLRTAKRPNSDFNDVLDNIRENTYEQRDD